MEISYRHLDTMAKAIAVVLHMHGISDGRVLLLYQPGLDLICAFFGCIYAGVVPILAYPPVNRKPALKLNSIVHDAQPTAVMSTNELRRILENLKRIKPLAHFYAGDTPADEARGGMLRWNTGDMKWIATDQIPGVLACD